MTAWWQVAPDMPVLRYMVYIFLLINSYTTVGHSATINEPGLEYKNSSLVKGLEV